MIFEFSSFNRKVLDASKKHEHLNAYTDEELRTELDNLESLPVHMVTWICAEILRRQLRKEKK